MGWIAVGLGGWLLAGYWVARAFGIAAKGGDPEDCGNRNYPMWVTTRRWLVAAILRLR